MRDWESTFRGWSKPAGQTEQTRQDNSERMIREAIAASPELGQRNIRVFAQGSYRNNTNVPRESDVDICVLCTDVCYTDYHFAPEATDAAVGLVEAQYQYSTFKDEVGRALVAKFGAPSVKRGNKAFDVRENSYHVEADVVPTFEHRRYHRRANGSYYYDSGVEFRPDNGGRIVNWPEQQYANGVEKNTTSGGRFKSMVRVLKNLRNEMADEEISTALPIPSFLIECLVWNAPMDSFGHDLYRADLRAVVANTFNDTMSDEKCQSWGEVSELKYLFRSGQPWTRQQAHSFLGAAWDYAEFD